MLTTILSEGARFVLSYISTQMLDVMKRKTIKTFSNKDTIEYQIEMLIKRALNDALSPYIKEIFRQDPILLKQGGDVVDKEKTNIFINKVSKIDNIYSEAKITKAIEETFHHSITSDDFIRWAMCIDRFLCNPEYETLYKYYMLNFHNNSIQPNNSRSDIVVKNTYCLAWPHFRIQYTVGDPVTKIEQVQVGEIKGEPLFSTLTRVVGYKELRRVINEGAYAYNVECNPFCLVYFWRQSNSAKVCALRINNLLVLPADNKFDTENDWYEFVYNTQYPSEKRIAEDFNDVIKRKGLDIKCKEYFLTIVRYTDKDRWHLFRDFLGSGVEIAGQKICKANGAIEDTELRMKQIVREYYIDAEKYNGTKTAELYLDRLLRDNKI